MCAVKGAYSEERRPSQSIERRQPCIGREGLVAGAALGVAVYGAEDYLLSNRYAFT